MTKEPIVINNTTARDLTWVGSTVTVGRGSLQYADIVKVSALQGEADLQGDYPLDLTDLDDFGTFVLTGDDREEIIINDTEIFSN